MMLSCGSVIPKASPNSLHLCAQCGTSTGWCHVPRVSHSLQNTGGKSYVDQITISTRGLSILDYKPLHVNRQLVWSTHDCLS